MEGDMADGEKHVVAMFQGVAENGDPVHNLEKMKEQIRKASSVGADIIVFPELFLTGYELSDDDMKRVAEGKDGPSFQELSTLAKQTGIAVVYGYPEVHVDRSSGEARYYNSAQLIDKDGTSLLNYRKCHLWLHDGREGLFTPGNAFTVVECCGLKIGLLICYDVGFPEAVRSLALKGAQVIIVPTALLSKYSNTTKYVVHSRALESKVYIVYVNHTQGGFYGHTKCCDPAGNLVVEAGDEESLQLAPIDASFKSQQSHLGDRRPELYQGIL